MKPTRRQLGTIALVWLTSAASAWLATRPVAQLLGVVQLGEPELLQEGGVELLELARLERAGLLRAARDVGLLLVGASWFALLPRGLLLRSLVRRDEPTASWLRGALGWLPRALLQRALVWLVAALVGVLLVFGPLDALVSLWDEYPIEFAVTLGVLAQLPALYLDTWSLQLARGHGLGEGARRAGRECRFGSAWFVRCAKSALGVGVAALGLVFTPAANPDGVSALMRVLALALLGLVLAALDGAYYGWLDARSRRMALDA